MDVHPDYTISRQPTKKISDASLGKSGSHTSLGHTFGYSPPEDSLDGERSVKLAPAHSDPQVMQAASATYTAGTTSRRAASGTGKQPHTDDSVLYALAKRPGDEPPVTVSAIKYLLDPSSLNVVQEDISITIPHPNRGLGQDELFVRFAVDFLHQEHAATPMIARMFRHNISDVSESDFIGDFQNQCICEEFARNYARLRVRPGLEKPPLPFITQRWVVRVPRESIPASYARATKGFFSYRTEDTGALLFVMEPDVPQCIRHGISMTMESGVAQGKVNNVMLPSGSSNAELKAIADAFSHFTYVKSNYTILVCGFRSSAGYLVDPIVRTTSGQGFGVQNEGRSGIERWEKKHQCNEFCRTLALAPIGCSEPASRMCSSTNYYVEFAKKLGSLTLNPPATRLLSTVNSPLRFSPGSNTGATSPAAVTCRAFRYFFDMTTETWRSVATLIRVNDPKHELSRGEHDVKFAVHDVSVTGAETPMIARMLARSPSRSAVFETAEVYYLCLYFANLFQESCGTKVPRTVLPLIARHVARIPLANLPIALRQQTAGFFSYRVSDSTDVWFVVEADSAVAAVQRELFGGSEQPSHDPPRHSAANDDDDGLLQVAQTFAHFILQRCHHQLLVGDFECANGFLRDPQVAAVDPQHFSAINTGKAYIASWVEHHECNALCRRMGLETLRSSASARKESSAVANRETLAFLLALHGYAACADHPEATIHLSARRGEGAAAVAAAMVTTMEAALSSPRTASSNSSLAWKSPVSASRMSTGSTTARHLVRCTWRDVSRPAYADVYPATQFAYDLVSRSWRSSDVLVRVQDPKRGLAQGAMRVCFNVHLLNLDGGAERRMMAKLFRHFFSDVVEEDYFNEAAAQRLSSAFAEYFNALLARKSPEPVRDALDFIPSTIIKIDAKDVPPELYGMRTGFFSYKTTDTRSIVFTAEPFLEGHFTKYNGNYGETYATNESRLSMSEFNRRIGIFEAAEALTHYSLTLSRGGLMVCDIQGVHNHLTDPEILTASGEGGGIGNCGRAGMDRFAMRHKCNKVCKTIGLPPLNGVIPQPKNNEHPITDLQEMLIKLQDPNFSF